MFSLRFVNDVRYYSVFIVNVEHVRLKIKGPQTQNAFYTFVAPESTTGEHESLRQRLEDLLKLMLVVWCKENQAIKVISTQSNGNRR